jgi:hypothetical protein
MSSRLFRLSPSPPLQGNRRRSLLKEWGRPLILEARPLAESGCLRRRRFALTSVYPPTLQTRRVFVDSYWPLISCCRLLLSVVAGCSCQARTIAENLAEVKPPGFLQLDACSKASVPPVQRSVARFPFAILNLDINRFGSQKSTSNVRFQSTHPFSTLVAVS